MSFEGSGDLQAGEHGKWQSNVLVSDPDARMERRWISIPTTLWHRPKSMPRRIGPLFHSVPAEELIEEGPDDHREAATRQNDLDRPTGFTLLQCEMGRFPSRLLVNGSVATCETGWTRYRPKVLHAKVVQAENFFAIIVTT